MASIDEIFEQRDYDRTDNGLDGYVITCFEEEDVIEHPSDYDIILPQGNYKAAFYMELETTKLEQDPAYIWSVDFKIRIYISDSQRVVLVREYPDTTEKVPIGTTDLKEWVKTTAKQIVLDYHVIHNS